MSALVTRMIVVGMVAAAPAARAEEARGAGEDGGTPAIASQQPPAASAARARVAPASVQVVADSGGTRLVVDGRDFMVFGVNWDYIPIGENYAFDLWQQPDDVIEEALGREMPLLRRMGANAIRVYAGIPARWIRYIFERYGIYTVVNHTVARYGFMLDGTWIPQVDYSDPRLRAAVTAEVTALVDELRGTPGLLMWVLGNENNYGLHWSSFEIEALPEGERDAARARYLYSLLGDIIRAVKAHDAAHPVAIANGDVQYIDIIAEECKGLDVFGANVYRGISSRDLFDVVKAKLGVPVMYTEFGADAYDARRMREDDVAQARYLLGQWREIYEQSAGKGRAGNAIGGFVFQWSDGWWKHGQESRLDVHDTTASWPNAAYPRDYVEGENNMNEEWWGICAKGPPDERGLYELHPRTAYYALQEAFRLPPYAPATDLAAIARHFDAIEPSLLARNYRDDLAVQTTSVLERASMTGARLVLETYSTGGDRILTPEDQRGFDHLESLYADFRVRPSDRLDATVSLNVLGNVPRNPIDEIFYENRGRPVTLVDETGSPYVLRGAERIAIYRASVEWDEPTFSLAGFYRTGHYHWGYEGDFFGLYREANYGENLDIYNGRAPAGFELTGKQGLQGLKLAFGPELWWGANPAVMAKYTRSLGRFAVTLMYQEDLAQQSGTVTSAVIPQPKTRKSTVQVATHLGPLGIEVGGIWSGSTHAGEEFLVAENAGGSWSLFEDHVVAADAFGGKAKLTLESGRWHWYAQAAYMGLVADAGPTATVTYTGWSLKDSGSGNQMNALMGLAVNVGAFQIAPNVLWQKPLVGPVPRQVGPPRNILADPFAVRANRETLGGELMLVFDPTPATWLWMWDNDLREDAALAASLDLVYRHQPTTQDAGIGITADGVAFGFNGAPPARDLWEARARVVSRVSADTRVIAQGYVGTAEPNGDDARLVQRYGGDLRVTWRSLAAAALVKVNDWGPYDYHRDFNLTFPLQVIGDFSYALGSPRWLGLPDTRFGFRGTLRYLDGHSPRYDVAASGRGEEYEFRTYLHVSL